MLKKLKIVNMRKHINFKNRQLLLWNKWIGIGYKLPSPYRNIYTRCLRFGFIEYRKFEDHFK